MSEQNKDAYEKEVRRIAEIIAMTGYKKRMEPVSGHLYGREFMYPRWEQISNSTMQLLIKAKVEESRAMVAEMAVFFTDGYGQAAKDYGHTMWHDDPYIKKHAIERGLIPSPTNVPGNDPV